MPHLPFVPPERQPKAPREPQKPRPVAHGHLNHMTGSGFHQQRKTRSSERRDAIERDTRDS